MRFLKGNSSLQITSVSSNCTVGITRGHTLLVNMQLPETNGSSDKYKQDPELKLLLPRYKITALATATQIWSTQLASRSLNELVIKLYKRYTAPT